jgi:hypothetical protein
VRQHRDYFRAQRKEQVRADRGVGPDAEKNQQRRRDCAGADAALRHADTDDEADKNEAPINVH